MSQDIFSYIRQLHQFIEAQQMRIHKLEKTMGDLKQEVEKLQKRPAVHVEKVEYHFDQLKVDTLDGVLNIGLSPNDPGNLENLEINEHGKFKTPLTPMRKMEATMRLEESLYQFWMRTCRQSLKNGKIKTAEKCMKKCASSSKKTLRSSCRIG